MSNNPVDKFKKMSISGNIPVRAYHRTVEYKNKLYVLMGADLSNDLSDMCYTDNLQKWDRNSSLKITNGNTISPRNSFGLCNHNNRVYFMGGYNGITRLNDVYVTSDMTHWEKLQNATWPGRMEFGLVSFQGKLWAIGGQNNSGYTNEIWSTTNGVDWKQENTPSWTARMACGCVVFGESVYVIGGIGSPGVYNDVWRTNDFRIWTRLKENADFAARYYHAVTCRDDSYIVVSGGYLSAAAAKDIWYSRNGKKWYYGGELPTTNLYGHSIIFYNNRLVVIGGTDDSVYYGDVWGANNQLLGAK